MINKAAIFGAGIVTGCLFLWLMALHAISDPTYKNNSFYVQKVNEIACPHPGTHGLIIGGGHLDKPGEPESNGGFLQVSCLRDK